MACEPPVYLSEWEPCWPVCPSFSSEVRTSVSKLTLRNVVKSYGGHFQVVHGIDLEVADEEFVVLVGPSGCGRTTTLRETDVLDFRST